MEERKVGERGAAPGARKCLQSLWAGPHPGNVRTHSPLVLGPHSPFPSSDLSPTSFAGLGAGLPTSSRHPSFLLPPSLLLSPCLPASLPSSLLSSSIIQLPTLGPWAESLSRQVPSRPDPNPPLDKAKPVQFSSALASPAQPPIQLLQIFIYQSFSHCVFIKHLLWTRISPRTFPIPGLIEASFRGGSWGEE